MVYEYRCTSCGNQVVTNLGRLEDEAPLSEWGHEGSIPVYGDSQLDCGPLKRVWSLGFQIKSTDWGH